MKTKKSKILIGALLAVVLILAVAVFTACPCRNSGSPEINITLAGDNTWVIGIEPSDTQRNFSAQITALDDSAIEWNSSAPHLISINSYGIASWANPAPTQPGHVYISARIDGVESNLIRIDIVINND